MPSLGAFNLEAMEARLSKPSLENDWMPTTASDFGNEKFQSFIPLTGHDIMASMKQAIGLSWVMEEDFVFQGSGDKVMGVKWSLYFENYSFVLSSTFGTPWSFQSDVCGRQPQSIPLADLTFIGYEI
ncbi:hypothetical protein V6N13_091300 [Hibiscus sabdariffa]